MEELHFALQHKKTKAYFLLLEDGLGSKMKVVNPEGDVIMLPEQHFDEEYHEVNQGNFGRYVEDAHWQTFLREKQRQNQENAQEMAEKKQRQQVVQQAKINTPEKIKSPSPSRPRARKSSAKSRQISDRKFSKPTEWSSGKLAFYRHKIEPLGLKDTFIIEVFNVGRFKLTRSQFESAFSDIILSREYKDTGVYSFSEIPERAMRFLEEN